MTSTTADALTRSARDTRRGSGVVAAADALIPLGLVCAYDTLRVSTYQAKGRPRRPITVERIGRSSVLRFDDVGYFNTTYSLGPDIRQQFERVEQLFEHSPHGCRLHSMELDERSGLEDYCRSRGWLPESLYAWMSGEAMSSMSIRPSGLTIRPPRRDEIRAYLETYLTAFDAAPERVPAAIDNMRHLFDEPALHFQLACDGARPVGVGMLLQAGGDALFCAGAMVPSHRRGGGHEALLAARFDLARRLGCARVHSWAFADSQSHRNLTRAGLETVGITRAWRWQARHP